MVLSETGPDGSRIITLQPNRSATWAETRLFLLITCGMTLTIGVFWTVIGAWMVLPFSGLEAGLLAFVLYRVSRNTYQRQQIIVRNDSVQIRIGMRFPRRSWLLRRPGTHLAITEGEHPLDAPALTLFDGRYKVELGTFLTREDKSEALVALKDAGLQVRSQDTLARALF